MEKNTLESALKEFSQTSGTNANDVKEFFALMSDGSIKRMPKEDMATVLGELYKTGFNGDFNDPVNFPQSKNGGIIRYNVSSDSFINGPIPAIYGIVEIIRRANEPSYQDHVVQWVYYNKKAYLRLGYRSTNSDTYDWGEWKQIY